MCKIEWHLDSVIIDFFTLCNLEHFSGRAHELKKLGEWVCVHNIIIVHGDGERGKILGIYNMCSHVHKFYDDVTQQSYQQIF